ncbi:Retrovirus-related Pol polyprotein from transposon TNT 1-94 [Vitis vinifera]|uniref:Retrovirus-related Pol polyprotein from transposon TNT 1-94 n=1 Tax=Vitis vinifera TaxID=29760 RepID=A0A438DI53_VITVI|nr:Retrovirus-related Pol polyprotein from transposon TNT 1-94 [Vitis vinifera]
MADTDPHSGEHSGESSISPSVLSELTARMTEALSKAPTSIPATDSAIAPIGIKLDGTNYALWSQVIEMYVAGKDKLGYINGDLPQPLTTDPFFRRWRTENATVKGWLIGSMDPSLIGNFIRFPTAKQVWDAIATTYFDGSDATQVYELRRRVARLRQGSGSLEKYYNDLQGLWREIDFRRPNPMQCPADIQHFNNMLQEDRVYTFLDGLDDKLDNIRSDVLQLKPFPTVEQAYAHVRREAVRQAVMTASNGEEAAGVVMASRSLKQGPSIATNSLSLNGKFSKSNGPSNDMKCSHSKRRRDGNGKDGGASKNAADGTGKAAIASAESQLSLIPTTTVDLDTGATDHMTYDASDFSERSSPRRTSIANANGDISLVKGAGTVMISPALSLTNTLFDILTKEIIGRGTKKGGSTIWKILASVKLTIREALVIEIRRTFCCGIVAVHLINRMPSRVLKFKTPLQALSTVISLPTALMLPPRVFGCVAFVHLHTNQRTKLDLCAVRCLFLGYGLHQKGYRCYDPSNHRTYVTMDVTFLESETFYSPTTSTSTLQGAPQNKELNWLRFDWEPVVSESNTELDVEPVVSVSNTEPDVDVDTEPGVLPLVIEEQQPQQSIVPPPSTVSKDPSPENIPEVSSLNTLSTPVLTNDAHVGYELPYRHNRGKPPDRYSPNIEDRRLKYPIANYVSTKTLPKPLKTFAAALSSCQVPTSVEEAMKDPRWVQAMKEEMEALLKNKTWILVNLPKGQKTVGCKWVFSIKYKVDGTIERYKARLVAKGFTQTYGVDYQETFSPVAKLNTVRVLLSLAANLDWPLHQFDVKNAFLHGELEEDIYMDIPSGYVANTEGNVVCKLQRTLYGLKQSPRAWFGRFSTAMKKYGFQQSNSDHTLFLKHRQGKLTALIVYVDDMIITGDDSEEIARLQEQLASEFEMKNLGGLKYFLGIEVARSKRGIFLSQRKYILDLLTEVGLLDCKPTETPIIPNHKLGEYPNQVPTDKGRYQRLVGKLIYLSHTRPDIAYAVSVVSQFMHCPSEDHMSAVMQILRYLKSFPGKGLMFSRNDHLRVEGYTDADWAGNIMDRKSTSGYFTFVGGNLVTWRSKKQKVVALFSAEAEFRGMAKGLCELLWLRRLLTEIGFAPDSEMKLFCDNKAAIDISHNPIQHDRTKHVEVDRHFIKRNLDAKIIQFPFVKSEDQLADILTKAVSSKIFHHSLDNAHGLGTAALSAKEPEALPFCAIAYALTGIFGSLLCSVPAVRQSLLAIVG